MGLSSLAVMVRFKRRSLWKVGISTKNYFVCLPTFKKILNLLKTKLSKKLEFLFTSASKIL